MSTSTTENRDQIVQMEVADAEEQSNVDLFAEGTEYNDIAEHRPVESKVFLFSFADHIHSDLSKVLKWNLCRKNI